MNYATFIISFKLILRKNNKVLILTESKTGFLDFPGGRIEQNEVNLPIKDLFKREVGEELGKNVKYKILGPAIQYRRYDKIRKIYVLITAYEAKYLSGEIELSTEHDKYEWVDPRKYNLGKKKFNNNEERLAIEGYFKKAKKQRSDQGIILVNVPRALHKVIFQAVHSGWKIFSRVASFDRPVSIVVLYDPVFRLGTRTLVYGYPLGNRDGITLILRLGLFFFQQRSRLFQKQTLTQSMVHELTHALRQKSGEGRTVIDSVIEEGIATFAASSLVAPPPYIDVKKLDRPSMLPVWRNLKPNFGRAVGVLKRTDSEGEGLPKKLYALGLYIINNYVRANPDISYQALLTNPRRVYIDFARKFFDEAAVSQSQKNK